MVDLFVLVYKIKVGIYSNTSSREDWQWNKEFLEHTFEEKANANGVRSSDTQAKNRSPRPS
jgi:hypothetical protein